MAVSYKEIDPVNLPVKWKWGKYKAYFDKAFNELGVIRVDATSQYRTTNNHASGNAIDVHGLKFKDNTYLVFHKSNYLYNKDMPVNNKLFLVKLMNKLNSYGLNFAFFSPELLYRNYGTSKLNKNNTGKTKLEKDHFTHLHIEIDSLKTGYPEIYYSSYPPEGGDGFLTIGLMLTGSYFLYKSFTRRKGNNG